MRGGTSRALMLRADDLPRERERWAPIFLALMGSPDANGRQLDGMGGGISSLSKICVIGPPSRPGANLDYTFAQIGIRDATVDYSGNCGNMSSAVGPFAVDEGLVPIAGEEAAVRIFNTNTSKLIVARFAMDGGRAAVDGAFVLPGVAGSGAPIRLEFVDPGGAATGRLLPTGNPIDRLSGAGFGEIEATLVDAANPCVFVAADTLGIAGIEMPEEIEARPDLLARLDAIRVAASLRMGIARDAEAARKIPSIPKVAAIAPPRAARTLSGAELAAAETNLHVRMISLGQPHRAVPLTGAMCLAVAARIPGSLAHRFASPGNLPSDPVRIGQPSGVTVVDADVSRNERGWHARQATVYRTARRLMEGTVYCRAAASGQ